MKKTILIALAIFTTGLVSSCAKDNVKPASVKTQSVLADKSDVGNGD